jgi:tetratricopeptide (TPR) repeat protein
MKCKICGENLDRGAAFCPHCGAKQDQGLKNAVKVEEQRINQVSDNVKRRTLPVIAIISSVVLLIVIVGSIIFVRSYIKTNAVSKNIELGNEYIKEEQYEEAVHVFNESIISDKKNTRAYIGLGKAYLELNRNENAKKAFEKAVLTNKRNKDVYLEIKDIYIKKKRLDDAFYIVKLAVDNNIKDADLEETLDEIREKLGITEVEYKVNVGESFELPQQIVIKINNEDMEVPISWSDDSVSTDKTGTFTFEGIADEYERPVKLTLEVLSGIVAIKEITAEVVQGKEYKLPAKVAAVMADNTTKEVTVKWESNKVDISEPGVYSFLGTVDNYDGKAKLNLTVKAKAVVKENITGFIEKVFEKDGKRYFIIDKVEFLTGEAAVKAAIKDGNADYDYETGQYYVPNDYYIVNNNPLIRTYEISRSASINIYSSLTYDYALTSVSYSEFMDNVNSMGYGMLCNIYIENDVVVKVEQQYVP